MLHQWGLLTQMKSSESGLFDIDLGEGADNYQITVANDGPDAIETTIVQRSRDNFLLKLSQGGLPYDPPVRCSVSVEVVPAN